MSVVLLDVNILIALAWPNHESHGLVASWFRSQRDMGFATCPMTEAGFVRISLNPLVVKEAKTPAVVLHLLGRFRALPGHEFWPDTLDLSVAFPGLLPVSGHRQVTDAYLLALALHHGGRLATMNAGIGNLLRDEDQGGLEIVA